MKIRSPLANALTVTEPEPTNGSGLSGIGAPAEAVSTSADPSALGSKIPTLRPPLKRSRALQITGRAPAAELVADSSRAASSNTDICSSRWCSSPASRATNAPATATVPTVTSQCSAGAEPEPSMTSTDP